MFYDEIGWQGVAARASLQRPARAALQCDAGAVEGPRLTNRIACWRSREGAHLFRHSLATELLRQGASLTEIGELLRHRSPQTTALYAKVDLAALRTLAMAWPGGVR